MAYVSTGLGDAVKIKLREVPVFSLDGDIFVAQAIFSRDSRCGERSPSSVVWLNSEEAVE
jgi:hypothetical protein